MGIFFLLAANPNRSPPSFGPILFFVALFAVVLFVLLRRKP